MASTSIEFGAPTRKLFRLWDYGFAHITYCSVKGLSSGDFDAAIFFSALLADSLYHDCYACGSPETHVTPEIHGPFDLAFMTPSNFVEVSFGGLLLGLETRFDDPSFSERPTAAQIEAVHAFLRGLPGNVRVFRLAIAVTDGRYLHDRPLHSFFDEYVVLDTSTSQMWLIVAGYD